MSIMPLGFATGPSLDQVERQPIKSNQDENNYQWQQMSVRGRPLAAIMILEL